MKLNKTETKLLSKIRAGQKVYISKTFSLSGCKNAREFNAAMSLVSKGMARMSMHDRGAFTESFFIAATE